MSVSILNTPLNVEMNFVKTWSLGIENIHNYCTI
jgi:hypothetical protein